MLIFGWTHTAGIRSSNQGRVFLSLWELSVLPRINSHCIKSARHHGEHAPVTWVQRLTLEIQILKLLLVDYNVVMLSRLRGNAD